MGFFSGLELRWCKKKRKEVIGKGKYSVLGPFSSVPLLANINTEKFLYASKFKRILNSLSSYIVVLSSGYYFLCIIYVPRYYFIYNLKALSYQKYATKVYAS